MWRYRDAVIGVVVSIFGVGWAMSSVGFMTILGFSVSIAGALLIFAGIQRGRFRVDADGKGVVSVDEGQVTYFGPNRGGTVHVDDLMQVDLAPADEFAPERRWLLLSQGADEPLEVPVNAVGAEHLFDVFAKLRGIRLQSMLDMVSDPPDHQVVIWRSGVSAVD